MLITCRRLFASTELVAVSLLIVALILLGIPLRVSLASSVLLIVAVVWQCAVGVSIWVRIIKPTRVELVDILGPCLATGAAFTALGWFAVCRISLITPQIFATLTLPFAIDGLRLLKTRYQKSNERQLPVVAVSIAILGLGYHRIGLLTLGFGLLTLIVVANAVKPAEQTHWSRIKTIVLPIASVGLLIFAFLIQKVLSNYSEVGFLPDSDINFGEAIALGLTSNEKSVLTPFTPDFRYHWLSHGWLGLMIRSLNLAPFIGPYVLVPLVVLTSSVCLVFSAFKRWRGSSLLTPAITALLIVAGCSVSDQLVFATDMSTSNLFGTLWLLLGGFYLFIFINEDNKSSLVLISSLLIGFLLMGTKGPLAIVLIAAAASHILGSMFEKTYFRRSSFLLVGLIFGSVTAYLVLVKNTFTSGGLSLSQPATGIAGYLNFAGFFAVLLLTRIPMLLATTNPTAHLRIKFLISGTAGMMIFAFITKSVGISIVYFATGAIALACFFGGLSIQFSLKNQLHHNKIIIVAASAIFTTSFFWNAKKIYFSVIPSSLSGDLAKDYAEKLLYLQKFLVIAMSCLILFALISRRLENSRLQFAFICLALASTSGVFVAQANSPFLRQLAFDNYNLDGGIEDSRFTNQSIINSATWIKNNSQDGEIVATNYSIDSQGIPYLVSVASQRPVLIESNNFIFPTLFVDDPETRVIATVEFFNNPNSSSAKALTDQGVQWYLYSIQNDQTSSSDLCAENEIWRCEYKNKYSVAIKFLP